ncbi:hypothetical protein KC217_24450, partial [Mycobacterium tuberculosis]|nr:hypothetical protein [Mycobacterium tuberculosis]
VLIVTTIDEPCVIRAALRLGISGVVPKTARKADIAAAIAKAIAGDVYLPEDVERAARDPPAEAPGGTAPRT